MPESSPGIHRFLTVLTVVVGIAVGTSGSSSSSKEMFPITTTPPPSKAPVEHPATTQPPSLPQRQKTPRPTPAPIPTVPEDQSIVNPWTQLGQSFGSGESMDLSADGSIFAGYTSGRVQIFSYDGATWSQMGQDLVGDNCSVALSANGTVVAVGADNYIDNDHPGYVRVFSSSKSGK